MQLQEWDSVNSFYMQKNKDAFIAQILRKNGIQFLALENWDLQFVVLFSWGYKNIQNIFTTSRKPGFGQLLLKKTIGGNTVNLFAKWSVS